MNCKECIYIKCLLRTDKEFTVCPVEIAKREYEEKKEVKSNEDK